MSKPDHRIQNVGASSEAQSIGPEYNALSMGFTSWYVSMLRNRPMLTNMGSAVVLMTSGDVLAQELEHKHIGDKLVRSKERMETVPLEKRLSLRRYYTVDSMDAEKQAEEKFEKTKNKHKRKHSTKAENHRNEEDARNAEISDGGGLLIRLQENLLSAVDMIQAEIEYLDGYRTATMIVWSAGIFTPLYVQIYKLMDRAMPKNTPATVAARVIIAVVISIPLNTAFYIYGTAVHHSAEWLAIHHEWNKELQAMGISPGTTDPYGPVIPYDWGMMWATAKLKLESELLMTVIDSAKVWVSLLTI